MLRVTTLVYHNLAVTAFASTGKPADTLTLSRAFPSQPKKENLSRCAAPRPSSIPAAPPVLSLTGFSVKAFRMYSSFHCLFLFCCYGLLYRLKYICQPFFWSFFNTSKCLRRLGKSEMPIVIFPECAIIIESKRRGR